MRRFTSSDAYVKIRLVFGGVFIALGLLVATRTFATAGFTGATLPAYVLAGAMMGLGFFRLRTFFQLRTPR